MIKFIYFQTMIWSMIPRITMPLLLYFFAFYPTTFGHTFLTRPEPYNRCENKGLLTCPPVRKRSDASLECMTSYTSPSYPAEFWKRGRQYKIRWVRNNHSGGTFSLLLFLLTLKTHTERFISLVPNCKSCGYIVKNNFDRVFRFSLVAMKLVFTNDACHYFSASRLHKTSIRTSQSYV